MFGLIAAEGLLKNEALRSRLQGMTTAVAVTVFLIGWVAGFAIGVHSALVQIHSVYSSHVTPTILL